MSHDARLDEYLLDEFKATQGLRNTLYATSNGRVTSFLTATSVVLVALGLIGQGQFIKPGQDAIYLIAGVLLAAFLLGFITFLWEVEARARGYLNLRRLALIRSRFISSTDENEKALTGLLRDDIPAYVSGRIVSIVYSIAHLSTIVAVINASLFGAIVACIAKILKNPKDSDVFWLSIIAWLVVFILQVAFQEFHIRNENKQIDNKIKVD